MKRLDIALKIREVGAVPLFYNNDIHKVKEVIRACYMGGMTVFEFTNRGELAHEIFGELVKWGRREFPDLILGIGSVVDAGTCSLYIQMGSAFIVSPLLNADMARVCNRRKVLWIPGCATVSEINYAEELGAEIVKIFPGPTVGGPKFLKAMLAPCPWSNILPSGGVEPTEENLRGWFEAGAFAVGMGSQLISGDIIKNQSYDLLQERVANSIEIIKKIR
ncbi:MAG: bifunctional 4-hydroxy-2-oxoglutarate aldolase/2-dehydro-3-deoxy-phosphogluconate aldolase [Bacteroidales bacterium]|nr:bifunctional 4-hydroxy-2-oxoglutarate aldolase/2-dehydro-3-deoxy-phosphogluconate aldolase [Bacteroidales bacterium]